MKHPDVIVVGAGMAGLSAACELQTAGRSVLVLDAQNYVGGRVKTDVRDGHVTELGAKFIHGENTVAAEAAREFGLTVVPAEKVQVGVGEDGRILDDKRAAVLGQLSSFAVAHGRPGISVAKLLANRHMTDDATLVQITENALGDYEATDASAIDSGEFSEAWRAIESNGANQVLPDGYNQLAEKLAEGLHLQLKTSVAAIDYANPDLVAVRLHGGRTVYAGKVVVTASLGVLQHGGIEFNPPLPREMRRTIERLSMGEAHNVLIYLDQPHGLEDSYHLAETTEDGLPTVTTWWGGADPRLLVGYCSGSRAKAVRVASPRVMRQKNLAGLSALIGRDITSEVRQYQTAQWSEYSNFYIRGAYSTTPPGVTNRERAVLAQPIEDRVYLAGEATVSDGNHATVHGAMMSGRRVAKQMLAAGQTLDGLV